MSNPTTPTPRARRTACPAWCTVDHTGHPFGEESRHRRTVTVGTASVDVELVTGRTPAAPLPPGDYVVMTDRDWVDGQDAHDLARALSIAAELVHPLGRDA